MDKRHLASFVYVSLMCWCAFGCAEKTQAPEPAKPAATFHNQKAAAEAGRRGNVEAALAALQKSVQTGEGPLDPVSVHGGFVGLRELPPDKQGWAIATCEAVEHLKTGNRSGAKRSLLSAMTRDGATKADGFLYLGLVYLEEGKNGAAEGALAKAVQNDRQCWVARLAQSVAMERGGRLEWAEGQLKRVANEAGSKPLVSFYLARRAVKAGDMETARIHMKRFATTKSP